VFPLVFTGLPITVMYLYHLNKVCTLVKDNREATREARKQNSTKNLNPRSSFGTELLEETEASFT